jgi:hypothetical protein
VLIAIARLIRRYHDAALSFLVPESWTPVVHQRELPDVTGDEEVVCHNDLAPWNTLFRDRRPAAFIDWIRPLPARELGTSPLRSGTGRRCTPTTVG